MTLPTNPPATTTPIALKTWAQNVVDTAVDHEDRLVDHETRITVLEDDPGGGGGAGGGMAYTVAASDAPAEFIARADYVCDGTADEVEIQAAITAIQAQTNDYGEIELSPGTFTLAAGLTIGSGARILIRGAGMIHPTGNAAATIVNFTAPADSTAAITCVGYAMLRDFQLRRTSTSAAGHCVSVTGSEFTAENMMIKNDVDSGSSRGITSTRDLHVVGCTIWTKRSACIAQSSNPYYTVIEDCYFENFSGSTATAEWAIEISRASVQPADWGSLISIRDCYLDGSDRGFFHGNDTPNIQISGGAVNYPSATYPAIYLEDCDGAQVEGVYVIAAATGAIGVGALTCQVLTVAGCFFQSVDEPIKLDASIDSLIDGNLISSGGKSTDNTYAGIRLDGASLRNVISHNVMRKNVRAGTTNDLQYGIRIDDAACEDNEVIHNSMFGAYQTAAILDNGVRTVMGTEDSTLPGWFQDNVAASQTAVALVLANGHAEIPMIADGYITGVVVFSNAARAAGTLTVDPTIDGTVTGLTAVLDGTNTTQKASTQVRGLDRFTAGQRVGVKITTDGSWAPTTADIDVAVLVMLNTANRS